MVSKKIFSAVLAALVILSIVGPTVAFAQTGNTVTTNASVNATKTATAKATQTPVSYTHLTLPTNREV